PSPTGRLGGEVEIYGSFGPRTTIVCMWIRSDLRSLEPNRALTNGRSLSPESTTTVLKSPFLERTVTAPSHERLSFLQPNVVKMNKPFISLCPEVTRSDA